MEQNATPAEVAAIKAIIKDDYDADPDNVKMLFLIGGVAGPRWNAESGGYGMLAEYRYIDDDYGLVDGVPRLGVGRVCMIRVSQLIFDLSEVELTRRYLNKEHAFRHRHTAFQARASAGAAVADSSSELKSIATIFGRGRVESGGPILMRGSSGYFMENSWTASVYAESNHQVVFGIHCSEHSDVDGSHQAAVASSGAYLAFFERGSGGGGGSQGSFYHWLAMGETLGACQFQESSLGPMYGVRPRSWGPGGQSLNGDPTLRLFIVARPSGLTITGNTLKWEASPDAGRDGFVGYHVYRAATMAGPFTRLTTEPVGGESWTDPAPQAGAVYQVRAIRLETSNTGTYYNNSQGIFATRGDVGIVASERWVEMIEGLSATFRVRLSSPPSSNIVVTAVRAAGTPGVTVSSGAELVFTPSDWSVWQTVTLEASFDDDRVDNDAAIRLGAPGLKDETVGVVCRDSRILVDVDSLPPEGGMGTLRIKLTGPPAGPDGVTASVRCEPYEWVGEPTTVISGGNPRFTAENWNEWQTVTVYAQAWPEDVFCGFKVVCTVTAPGYVDNSFWLWLKEAHSNLGMAASPAAGGTVTPAQHILGVVKGEPVPISAVAAPGYRFAGWSAIGDMLIDDPSSPNTTATAYGQLSVGTTAGSMRATANFVAGSAVALTTVERDRTSIKVPVGGTATVQVRLSAQPPAARTVSARISGPSSLALQPTALTFTTANWDQWQTITVANAFNEDGLGSGYITLSGSGLVASTVRVVEDDSYLLRVYCDEGGVAATPDESMRVSSKQDTVIRAVPNAGWSFAGWVIRGSGTFADQRAASTTVRLYGDSTVVATFERSGQASAPTCVLVQPGGDLAVQSGMNVTFAATASSSIPNRTISRIQFFRDGVLVGEDLNEPYTFEWATVPSGVFEVTARATDSQGLIGKPARVLVAATPDGQWPGTIASGGDAVRIYTTNDIVYRAHIFTNLGARALSISSGGEIEYLVVAGGGGGGTFDGGGGGAGGMLTGTATVAEGPLALRVGGGGVGYKYTPRVNGQNGGDSYVEGIATAVGGGSGCGLGLGARSGGSGGGGAGYQEGTKYGAAGTPGQGYSGGNGGASSGGAGAGGGGGGAGGPGVDNNGYMWAPGGSGLLSDITGVPVVYATGGGGRPRGTGSYDAPPAESGTGNGGDAGAGAFSGTGGTGGSGIVVVRYALTGAAAALPVIYDANGATGGTPPAPQSKVYGVALTVPGNTGGLVRAGYAFAGWNTSADGTGDAYAPGGSYTANRSTELDSSVTLYAVWTAASYTVRYDANGANSGTAPGPQSKVHGSALTVAANAGGLARVGYIFTGWNTADNGLGVSYAPGAVYDADADVTLHARWESIGYLPPLILTEAWAEPNTVILPAGTTVEVLAADQDGGDLDYWWTQVSGPGTATFASPASPRSGVTFSAAGTYVLRVSVRNPRGVSAGSDVTVSAAGIMTDPVALKVPEGGTSVFRVKITGAPSGNVTVSVANISGDTDIGVQSGGALTFGPANWDNWQTVTLACAEDDDDTEDSGAVIGLSAPGWGSVSVLATESDNDTLLRLMAALGGAVAPDVTTVVTRGVPVPITATPEADHSFVSWSVNDGDAEIEDSEAASTTVIVTAPSVLRATFEDDLNPVLPVVMAWGGNGYGQLGDGTTINKLRPIQVADLSGVMQIAGGYGHSAAVTSDGSAWSWGWNNYGQLGDGNTLNQNRPIQVAGLTGVTQVACGV